MTQEPVTAEELVRWILEPHRPIGSNAEFVQKVKAYAAKIDDGLTIGLVTEEERRLSARLQETESELAIAKVDLRSAMRRINAAKETFDAVVRECNEMLATIPEQA